MSLPVRIAWGAAGMLCLMGIAWLLSNQRRKFPWRVALWGVGLQVVFAAIILKTGPGRLVFEFARNFIAGLLSFTDKGAGFLFGRLYEGGDRGTYYMYNPASGLHESTGVVFALHVLLTIIFFASLMSILYHIGVMQWIVSIIARGMKRVLGTSGAETLCVSANIFVGQTEAPLVVRPYLDRMTESELMAVMVGGFATVAGGVMAAYARFGIDPGHLLAASVMSAPAALVFAKIIRPETATPETAGGVKVEFEKTSSNTIDAAATGATDGLKLALNVAAMLMAFIALVAMLDFGLGKLDELIVLVRDWANGDAAAPAAWGLSLAMILGYVFYPFALMLGISPDEGLLAGRLLGTKVAVNEFLAYIFLGGMRQDLSPRAFDIMTYALCGFANFSSIAIQIGGISAIAPGRRADLARIGLLAMIGGAFASWQTAAIAGMFIDPEDSAAKLAEYRSALADPAQARPFQREIDVQLAIYREFAPSETADHAMDRIRAIRTNLDGAGAMDHFGRVVSAVEAVREEDPELARRLLQAAIDRYVEPERYGEYMAWREAGRWRELWAEFLPEMPLPNDANESELRETLEQRAVPELVRRARELLAELDSP